MTRQEEHEPGQRPSKTQRKKDMLALQKLGEELAGLKSSQLARLSLSDELLAALTEYHRLPNSHGARKRQLQFIGRIMRDSDHETLERQLSDIRSPGAAQKRRSREIDRWMERLLTEGDEAVTRFLEEHPDAQRQTLRQLIRNCLRAGDPDSDDKTARLRRRLRDYVKSLLPQ